MFKLPRFVLVNPFLMPTFKENKVLWIIFSEVIHFFGFFLAFYRCLRTFTSVWDFQFSVAANQYTSNPVSPNLPGPRAQASLAKETEDSGNEKW